jgi:PAS domain S-box-containing protein
MPKKPARGPIPSDRTLSGEASETGAALSIPMGFLTALANAATLDELFEAIAAQLPGIFPADRISIALRHSDTTLSVAAVQGSTIQYDAKPIPIAGTKIGECFSTRRAIVVNDADRPNQKYARAQTPGQNKYRSTAILPLTVGDECLGTLNFGCLAADAFDAPTVDDLGEIATWIALQISRYQAVDRLKASDSRFNALIDNAHSMIFAKSADGRMLIANTKFCETFGLQRGQVIGRTDAEIFGTDAADQWRDDDQRVLNSESGETIEEQLPHADGTLRTHITQKFPVFDAALGEHIICAISTDISEQKQTAKALAESEGRARAFFENSPNMMFTKDADQRLTFVNPEYLKFYGQSEAETLHRTTPRDVDPERRAELQAIDEAVLRDGVIRRDELQLESSTGEMHTLFVTKFPIYDPDGMILGMGGVNTDITELRNREKELQIARDEAEMAAQMFKEAADKAQIADQAKSNFLASMSHELRTPLNGTLGMATLLLDSGLDADQAKMVDTIRASGQSLLMILNDILDLSKIEADELQPENRDFDLKSLMAGIDDMWRPQVAAKGLDWACRTDDLIASVLCSDSARLRQVIFNLVSNALKFTDAGSIALSVAQSSRSNGLVETVFEVADTGAGIPTGMGEKLFEKFTQADSTITRRYGGTGLGLAICKSLVERMGGEIAYESEPGRGTTFRFTVVCLPGSPDASADNADETDGSGQTPAQSLRVLVAEDNAVNQQVIQLMLLRAGHRCDLVGNGLEAVAAVRARPYDLVIMDIQMPEMDGITATQRIRALGGPHETLPVIALTANAMKGDREQYLAAGMDDYVAKPIEPNHLNAAIARQTAVAANNVPTATPNNGRQDKPAAPALSADIDKLFDDLDLPD